ncbi:MAG: hypothetical protein E4H14_11410 [Candidatus Thorarchaeota archaeon]|nr:MAG: hypothetical protein E4H14_11410 [Candidatus Thorarchaeota archaeon]
MRERVLSILLLLLCVNLFSGIPLSSAQARSEQEVILGTEESDIATDMVVDSTGSVIVVGRSEITSSLLGKFYAVKVSSSGETLWTKLWNVTASDALTGVAVDSADNILMIGVCNLSTDKKLGVIYKFDPGGAELWSIQIDNINYVWFGFFDTLHYCLDIQMHPTSDDFFVVGSVNDDQYMMFVSRYDSSGTLVWDTNWYGPLEYKGSKATLMWLSSQNWTVVAGWLYEDPDSYLSYDMPIFVAFDFNGLQVWNSTYSYFSAGHYTSVGLYSAGFEFDTDEYIYATHAGRAFDHIVRGTYDFNETWSFDMIIDEHHSVIVSGFLANGTDNLIGYGKVTSLSAGSAVIKSFQPAYSGFQPPQTLIFSFTPDGELLWYDYLVLGRISSPCGSQFDSDNRLIIAGSTSVWDFDTCDFYIVFGFIQTPFPSHNDNLDIFFFPIFNLLALCSIGGLEGVRSRRARLPSTSQSRFTLWNAAAALLLLEFALYIALYEKLVGLYGPGGPPSPLVYYPIWVRFLLSGLFYSLVFPALVCLAIWLWRKRTKS